MDPPPVTASNVPKWAFCKLDVEAAHRAYFVHAWSDPEDDTQLCLHAFFDVPQLGIGRNTLNACNEFFFLLPCQPQYASIAARVVNPPIPIIVVMST
ncbi:MAG: hypothetical protein V7606_4670 [Burkholderiales bacterium]